MSAVKEEIRIVQYGNINVSFMPYLDGGGRGFGQEYIRVIHNKLGKVNHVYEFCAGPGFIGFSLLAHNLCDKLTLADINPDAVECVKKTIKDNHLENKVSVYLSDCLDQIPSHEQWDLVVSNPPHWPATEKEYKENIRNYDPYLRVHQKFYDTVGRHLKADGSLIIQELELATSIKDFRLMIEANGLEVIEVFKAKPLSLWECIWQFKNIRKRTKPSAFYFIWSKKNSKS